MQLLSYWPVYPGITFKIFEIQVYECVWGLESFQRWQGRLLTVRDIGDMKNGRFGQFVLVRGFGEGARGFRHAGVLVYQQVSALLLPAVHWALVPSGL